MNSVSNEQELMMLLEKIAEDVINIVSNNVVAELKSQILKDVYNSHGPNKTYKASYEFLNSFHFKKIEKSIGSMVKELFYDWQSMDFDKATLKHSSYSKDWPEDIREYLSDYFDKEGKAGRDSSLWLAVYRRPFWTNFINSMFSGGKLDQMFQKEFNIRGIKKGGL